MRMTTLLRKMGTVQKIELVAIGLIFTSFIIFFIGVFLSLVI